MADHRYPEVTVWFCPACGERMAGRSYEVDEGRAKCTKTKHKALAVGVTYVAVSVAEKKVEAVEEERDVRLKVPVYRRHTEVEELAEEYASWSSDKPWDKRHPKNQEHWRKVARVLIVARREGFGKVFGKDEAALDSARAEGATSLLADLEAEVERRRGEAASFRDRASNAETVLAGDSFLRKAKDIDKDTDRLQALIDNHKPNGAEEGQR